MHEAGVRVMSGVKVTAVDVEKTAIVLEDGARISADLIIGADGVHVSSQNTTWHLRAYSFPFPVRNPTPSGGYEPLLPTRLNTPQRFPLRSRHRPPRRTTASWRPL